MTFGGLLGLCPFLAAKAAERPILEDGEVSEGGNAAIRSLMLRCLVLQLFHKPSIRAHKFGVLRLCTLPKPNKASCCYLPVLTHMCVCFAASEGGRSADRQICRKEGCYCEKL